MSTFNKIYKKVANNGNDSDYQAVATVGINGVDLAVMTGASSSSDGEIGLVPKPTKGNQNKYLRADGTWQTPPDTNTTYDVFNGSNNGLVPKTDKSTYFLNGNGSWGYPWIGSWSDSGKTLICLGSGDDQLSKVNIPEASTSSNGLMSAEDKLYHDFYGCALMCAGWGDVKIPVGTVTNNSTKYFNYNAKIKVYKNIFPNGYKLYEAVVDNKFGFAYEPSFMGCTFGGIDDISNGADAVLTKGSDSSGDYIEISCWITGSVRNHNQGDHTLTLLVRVDFYVSKYQKNNGISLEG